VGRVNSIGFVDWIYCIGLVGRVYSVGFVDRYKKLASNGSSTVHQSVLDYTLEQELLGDSQVFLLRKKITNISFEQRI
jgi:hypothetical protein